MENFGNHIDVRRTAGDRLGEAIVHCRDLQFSYASGGFSLRVPEFTVLPGEQIALVGPSGCGKTTLIHLIAGILKAKDGMAEVCGVSLSRYSSRDLQDFRILRLGLIFQQFELLSYLNVLENVLLPFRLNPVLELKPSWREVASELLLEVGLGDKTGRFPSALSQGERQRVAVCRALVTQPTLLLCDEPTANLDPENRDHIMGMLSKYCETNEASMLMVTHDHELLPRFDRIVDIREFTGSKGEKP